MNKFIRTLLTFSENFEALKTLIADDYIKMEDVLQELTTINNPKMIYEFALYFKDIPMDILVTAIKNTKDAEYMCLFALNVPGAPIYDLTTEVIRYGNIRSIKTLIWYKKTFDVRLIKALGASESFNTLASLIRMFSNEFGTIFKNGTDEELREVINIIDALIVEFNKCPDNNLKRSVKEYLKCYSLVNQASRITEEPEKGLLKELLSFYINEDLADLNPLKRVLKRKRNNKE